jgi:hypothetical protein
MSEERSNTTRSRLGEYLKSAICRISATWWLEHPETGKAKEVKWKMTMKKMRKR